MQTIAQDNPYADPVTINHADSRRALWTGRVLSGLAVAFLVFDSVAKVLERVRQALVSDSSACQSGCRLCRTV
jgi:hypothetical protein